MLAKKHYGIKQQHCGSLRKLAAPRQPARNNPTFHGAATQRIGLEDSVSFPQWVSGQAGTAILRSVACSASDASAANAAPAVDPGMLIIHYVRKDHNYKGWGLHVWGDSTSCTQWQQPLKPTRVTERGLVWELPLRSGARRVGALVHKGEQKAASGEVSISAHGSTMSVDQATGAAVQEAWLVGAEQSAFAFPPDMSRIPAGSINKQAAHWVSPGLVLWRQAAEDVVGRRRFRLHYSRAGYMHITGAGVQGADASWDLEPQPPAAASPGVKRFPHLYGCTALAVPPEAGAAAAAVENGGILAGQLLVSVHDAAGDALDATGVQNTLKPSSPGLIVFPMNEGDVRKVVTFAAKFRIRLVGKCSGHDQLQRSNGYGVIQLVTTKGFRNISYNETDHTITFGAGNAHKDTYAFLAEKKRFAVGGTWAYVCPAGCLSNGCYGFFTKEFGSGADNVVGLRFMLFNGTTLNLDAAGPHRDLFWAILGGGASSYGVLLGITAKTYEAPDQFIIMKVFLSIWPTGLTKDQAPSVFTRFLTNLTWYQALPPYISWQLDNNPAEQRVLLQISYTGRTTVDVATEELSGLVAEWTEAGYYQEHGVDGYSDVADFAVKNSGAGPPIRRVSQSIYVDANQDALDKVAALWETLYSDAYLSPVGGDPFDGAFNFWAQYRYGPGSYAGKAPHVARGMRTAMMEIAHENVWMRQADDSFRAAISNDVKELMEPLGNTSYQNHCSTWAEYNVYEDYKTRFYQNWEGLTAVKKKYDPCNLYVVQYGPGWDMPKATCGLSTTSTKRPPPKRPPPRRHA